MRLKIVYYKQISILLARPTSNVLLKPTRIKTLKIIKSVVMKLV